METPPFPLKECKFWSIWFMLGTHGQWAGRFFFTACHTYCETGHWPFTMVISYDPWYLHIVTWLKYCRYGVKLYPHNQSVTPIAELLEVELLLPVFTNDLGLSRLWFEHSTFRLRSECSTPDFLNTLRWFKSWSLACCCEILSFTPRNKLQRVKCFWPVRHSLIQSVRQSWFSCQRNSSETAHQKHIHRKFWFNFYSELRPLYELNNCKIKDTTETVCQRNSWSCSSEFPYNL